MIPHIAKGYTHIYHNAGTDDICLKEDPLIFDTSVHMAFYCEDNHRVKLLYLEEGQTYLLCHIYPTCEP